MKTMKVDELKKRMEQGDVILIDVRQPAEHRSACIEGACLIPLDELCLEKLPSKSKPIVLHCQSEGRSTNACLKLSQMDPSLEIYSLEGGLGAWQQAGYGIKSAGAYRLPLDRQTQLAVGFLVFSGTMLGTFVHPGFYVVPGFLGMGLMFAAMTGWCGMALLLSKMPWNQ